MWGALLHIAWSASACTNVSNSQFAGISRSRARFFAILWYSWNVPALKAGAASKRGKNTKRNDGDNVTEFEVFAASLATCSYYCRRFAPFSKSPLPLALKYVSFVASWLRPPFDRSRSSPRTSLLTRHITRVRAAFRLARRTDERLLENVSLPPMHAPPLPLPHSQTPSAVPGTEARQLHGAPTLQRITSRACVVAGTETAVLDHHATGASRQQQLF